MCQKGCVVNVEAMQCLAEPKSASLSTKGCRCVAASCNLTHKGGVSLLAFPKHLILRQKWTIKSEGPGASWNHLKVQRSATNILNTGALSTTAIACQKL